MVDVERTFESFGYLENIVEEGVDGKQYHEYLQSRLFSPTNTYDDDDDDDDDDDEDDDEADDNEHHDAHDDDDAYDDA